MIKMYEYTLSRECCKASNTLLAGFTPRRPVVHYTASWFQAKCDSVRFCPPKTPENASLSLDSDVLNVRVDSNPEKQDIKSKY